MKRLTSILLILLLVCSVFSVTALSTFAEEADLGDVAGDTIENANKLTDALKGLLEQVRAIAPMEALEEFKNEAIEFVNVLIAFLKHQGTYEQVSTAILAILGFIFLPIIIGLIVVAYVAIALGTVFASVLVGIVKVLLTVLVAMIPM